MFLLLSLDIYLCSKDYCTAENAHSYCNYIKLTFYVPQITKPYRAKLKLLNKKWNWDMVIKLNSLQFL